MKTPASLGSHLPLWKDCLKIGYSFQSTDRALGVLLFVFIGLRRLCLSFLSVMWGKQQAIEIPQECSFVYHCNVIVLHLAEPFGSFMASLFIVSLQCLGTKPVDQRLAGWEVWEKDSRPSKPAISSTSQVDFGPLSPPILQIDPLRPVL